MRLRLLALGLAVVGTAFWLFGGPNLGWTKNRVAVTKVDAVTELEFIEWQKSFVPGVDFLCGTLLLVSVGFSCSWLARPRPPGLVTHP